MTAHSATMVSGGSPWSEKFQELLINWGGGGEGTQVAHVHALETPQGLPHSPLTLSVLHTNNLG